LRAPAGRNKNSSRFLTYFSNSNLNRLARARRRRRHPHHLFPTADSWDPINLNFIKDSSGFFLPVSFSQC
jgi:hypothetical protein